MGILHDEQYEAPSRGLEPVEAILVQVIEEQRRAAEEPASKDILRSIHRAFDEARNLIIINNAHRDFVFAARNRMLKLRYICRLYIKELVLKNFPGLSADQLLERMVELSVYTEEHLK